ncbi:MAG: hypothetical protein J7647_14790 [Cyanobacteria bacterium SBLK]|nr:hypothetical protein [Cyanobacteria bacterium SBLK]
MDFNITPYISIGPLELGMTRAQIRACLRGNPVFLPAESNSVDADLDRPASDYFEEDDVKVEYDDKMECEFVEVGAKSNVILNGVSLFDLSFAELYNYLQSLDADLLESDAGCISLGLGIAIFGEECLDDPQQPCELISLFKRGYYDELLGENAIAG